jgi:CHAT domain-containing protein
MLNKVMIMPSPDDEIPQEAHKRTLDAVKKLVSTTGGLASSRGSYDRVRSVVDRHHDILLTDLADDLMHGYMDFQSRKFDEQQQGELVRWWVLYPLEELRVLLRRCREIGIAAAFDEKNGMLAADFAGKLLNFFSYGERSGDWPIIKAYLERSPELLTAQAMHYLEDAEDLKKMSFRDDQLTVGELFARIGSDGIDGAFADLVEFGMDVPMPLRLALRSVTQHSAEYNSSRDRMSLNLAVADWNTIVKHEAFTEASPFTRRTCLRDAGDAFEHQYNEHGETKDLDRAIELWHQSAEVVSRSGSKTPAEQLFALGRSHERRRQLRGTAEINEACVDLGNAMSSYELAYEAANEATKGPIMPAPVEGDVTDAMSRLIWLRRQKARYKNAAGLALYERFWLTMDLGDLNQAADQCRAAIDVVHEDNSIPPPFLYDDLASILSTRYRQNREDTDRADALDAYKRALELCHGGPPSFGLDAAAHYGQFLYDLGKFDEARVVLEKAHDYLEATRTERTSQRRHLELAGYAADFYTALVACCLDDNLRDDSAAFRFASAAKSRTFSDVLAKGKVEIAAALGDNRVRPEDLQTYLERRDEMETVRTKIFSVTRTDNDLIELLTNKIKLLRIQERELWADLTSRYPFLATLGDAPGLIAQDAQELAAELGATLIEYYQHREGWCAFVVTADDVQCKPLPDLNDTLLAKMENWVSSLSCKKVNLLTNSEKREEVELLTAWYDAVVRPVSTYLTSVQMVVVAPFGRTHLLPYYAGVNRETGRSVIDDFVLGFAPSLSALRAIWRRYRDLGERPEDTARKILAVAHPGSPGMGFLKNVVPETKAVIDCFSGAETTQLLGVAATPDAVISAAPGQDVLHLSCHAMFDPTYPAQSGLALSTGWLTVRRIVSDLDLRSARLFTMSACSTAVTELGPGDEPVGLIQAALSAGAPTVIASHWPAHDIATCALFTDFYREFANGVGPATAMRTAALAVRARSEWKHPYFWCAFTVSGLGDVKWHGPHIRHSERKQ